VNKIPGHEFGEPEIVAKLEELLGAGG